MPISPDPDLFLFLDTILTLILSINVYFLPKCNLRPSLWSEASDWLGWFLNDLDKNVVTVVKAQYQYKAVNMMYPSHKQFLK